jgi:hypothetical protein
MSQQARRLLARQSPTGALRRILAPGVFAFFLASPGAAFAGPLEPVTAPVSKTIEIIAAPVTGSPPPAPSVSTPAPVQIPVTVAVEPPTLPVKLPATASLEPVTSAAGSTATSAVASPTVSKTVASAQSGVETAANSVTRIAGEVTGAADRAAGESGAPVQEPREAPTAEALPGAAGAATGVDRVERRPKTARVAPLGDWFVRIWPAVALGRSTLDVVLGGWPQIALRMLERDGTVGFGANHGGGGSGSGGGGLGDLASSVDLPGPARWFVPETPLPLAVVYVALAGGLGAIWYLSRREVGLRTASRRRRP